MNCDGLYNENSLHIFQLHSTSVHVCACMVMCAGLVTCIIGWLVARCQETGSARLTQVECGILFLFIQHSLCEM